MQFLYNRNTNVKRGYGGVFNCSESERITKLSFHLSKPKNVSYEEISSNHWTFSLHGLASWGHFLNLITGQVPYR